MAPPPSNFAFTAFAVFLVFTLVLWLFKRLLFRRLKSWAAKPRFVWGDILVSSLDTPVNWLILASALAVFEDMLPLSHSADAIAAVAFKGAVIFAVALFVDNIVHESVRHAAIAGKAHGAITSGVIQGLVRGFIIAIAALIFLQLIGISVTPVLASLGIGSLAVALALQDTLSNFFAGIYISMDKPVQAGDFVRLESGDEGSVVDVGWRSTRIRTGGNNVVIIPNAKLIGSVLTNYNLPTREVAVTVDFLVAGESDLEKVEKAAREAAVSLKGKVLGLARDAEPAFHFQAIVDGAVRGQVVVKAREFAEAGPVKHEMIKALHAQFKKEGISYPTGLLLDKVLKR